MAKYEEIRDFRLEIQFSISDSIPGCFKDILDGVALIRRNVAKLID